MKHRLFLIAALIVCSLAAGALCSSCKVGAVALINLDDNLRMAGSGFDLSGIVTDEDGNPIDGVTMRAEYSRVNTATFHSEDKREEPVEVNSEFHIKQKGWTELDLDFSKDGYYSERLHFDSPWLDRKQKKYVVKDGIQVKMIKKGPVAELFRKKDYLRYDIENGYKDICDLSFLCGKKITREDWERPLMKTPLGTPPETPKYIELDFRRDEKGDIIYDARHGGTPVPSSVIVRFHSDDPDDGLMLIDELDPRVNPEMYGFAAADRYRKIHTTAPETGYGLREIELEWDRKRPDGNIAENQQTFLFLKCGNHYGKAAINSPLDTNRSGKRELGHVRVKIELLLNRVPGDRNLTSYY